MLTKDNNSVFSKKNIIITGHTGFKGSWLALWLRELGANITGISLDPIGKDCFFLRTNISNFVEDIRQDIRQKEDIINIFKKIQPEFVFHLAAQPIVRNSYDEPVYTFDTNIMGTINILEAIRTTNSVKSAVIITTDKVYENKESGQFYKESDPLGGWDPYSASKACTEIIVDSYRKSFFSSISGKENSKFVSSARAGNVIGGGDWQSHRLVPDCVNALHHDIPINIRNPQSTRPWQHVIDALGGYLTLARQLYLENEKFTGPWNFGPEEDSIITVSKLADLLIKFWKSGTWISKHNKIDSKHEANLLALDISKAKKRLSWNPVFNIEESIKLTVDWYKKALTEPNLDLYDFSLNQIKEYYQKAELKNIKLKI